MHLAASVPAKRCTGSIENFMKSVVQEAQRRQASYAVVLISNAKQNECTHMQVE